MTSFKVGDMAIGCRHVTLPDRNGMACKIMAPLQPTVALEVRIGAYTTKMRYRVCWEDGLESLCQPHTLRKPSRREIARQTMLECIARAMRAAHWNPIRFVVHESKKRQFERCTR